MKIPTIHVQSDASTRLTIIRVLPLLLEVSLLVLLSSSSTSDALSLPSSSSKNNRDPVIGKTTKNVATQILQGTGDAAVDLNQYNLASLEEIEREWAARLVQKVGEQGATPELGAQSDARLRVDTIQASFPAPAGGGLGLELVELAGGREDGLGITVIAGLVEGGAAAAASSRILPGDSIARVSIVRRRRRRRRQPSTTEDDSSDNRSGLLADVEEEFVVNTECLSYDATVAAIQSLPLPNDDDYDDDYYVLTLKRLRRKPKVTVKLQYPPSQNEPDMTLELFAGENLRHGMLVRGVKLNDPLAKRFDTKNGGNCGAGGLCRTCIVSVLQGGDLLNPQRLAEQQMLADNPRWRLACKAIVGYGMTEGEMTIRVNPRQW